MSQQTRPQRTRTGRQRDAARIAPTGGDRLDRAIVLLLAVTAGAGAANIYYAQPLLHEIGGSLGVSAATAGILVAASQLGYALGLLLLVPLGDLVERRTLMVGTLVLGAGASALSAAAPSFAVLAVGLLALGVLSTVAQVAVPLGSDLAGDRERGAVVGTIMSGLLIGILGARTVSGLLAEVGGWRVVFAAAAVGMLVLAAVLWRRLPGLPAPARGGGYRSILRSVGGLIAAEPVLRHRMAIGACGMAGFSVLWTASSILLGSDDFGWSEAEIGLLGLAGIAGALTAPAAGRLADRGRGTAALTGFLLLALVSWLLLLVGSSVLPALVLGIVLFDAGVQGQQISNQSAVYALRPEARSRLTTAYMTAYFTGGVAGSLAGSAAMALGGWPVACAIGAAFAVAGLALWLALPGPRRASA